MCQGRAFPLVLTLDTLSYSIRAIFWGVLCFVWFGALLCVWFCRWNFACFLVGLVLGAVGVSFWKRFCFIALLLYPPLCGFVTIGKANALASLDHRHTTTFQEHLLSVLLRCCYMCFSLCIIGYC